MFNKHHHKGDLYTKYEFLLQTILRAAMEINQTSILMPKLSQHKKHLTYTATGNNSIYIQPKKTNLLTKLKFNTSLYFARCQIRAITDCRYPYD